jgi:hypothetical protein
MTLLTQREAASVLRLGEEPWNACAVLGWVQIHPVWSSLSPLPTIRR